MLLEKKEETYNNTKRVLFEKYPYRKKVKWIRTNYEYIVRNFKSQEECNSFKFRDNHHAELYLILESTNESLGTNAAALFIDGSEIISYTDLKLQ